MNSSEDIHDLTESIYRNLSQHFSPAVKQILTCARNYHRALLEASTAARAYIESMGRLGHHCRNACQGGTEEIGEAIFRIAEIQKELQLKFEDCNKALFAEVVIPFEQKLGNDFRNATAERKKYDRGHKNVFVPHSKAQEAYNKFLKKHSRSSSRLTAVDEEKEITLKRTMERTKSKLEEFRLQGLKLALLEERRCYCFVLARLSSVSTIQLYYHDRGKDLLKADLSGWKQLCSQPNILPLSADPLLHVMDNVSNSSYTVYTPNEAGHSPYRHIPGPSEPPHPDYNVLPASAPGPGDTQPRSVLGALPQPPALQQPLMPGAQGEVQARTLYSHPGGPGSQLAFTQGDLLTPIGHPADGWQFGQNSRTGQYGWFPLSFTDMQETRRPTLTQTPLRYRQRAKSFSDLNGDARAMSEFRGWSPDVYNVPGTQHRPRSLHEASLLATPVLPQLLAPAVEGTYTASPFLAPGPSAIYILGTRSQPVSRAPSPPLPPPPPAQLVHGVGVGGGGGGGGAGGGGSATLGRLPGMRSVHYSQDLAPAAAPARQPSAPGHPHHPHHSQHAPVGSHGPPAHAPPPPPYPPPSAPLRPLPGGGGPAPFGSSSSQHNVVVQGLSAGSRASSPPVVLEEGEEDPPQQTPQPRPPPPPPPPPPPAPPLSGLGGAFSNVILRKTQTDDRSAPQTHL